MNERHRVQRLTQITVGLLICAALAGCATTSGGDDEMRILEERRIWWQTPGHGLKIDAIRPLEQVTGQAGPPLPFQPGLIDPHAIADAIAYVSRGRTQSLLIWVDGALRVEHYGEGFGPQSRSAPASMPKPVLALAVGAAVDRDLMSLDDLVEKWLTEWKEEPRGKITVRQLLQMRSGLEKYGAASKGGPGEDIMLGTRLEETVLQAKLVRKPGSMFDYNNVDNALLAIALQRATKTRYAKWLSLTIWTKIGAHDADVWLDRPNGLARTFCCLITTARDWVRVGLLIKDRGIFQGKRVLSKNWMDAMSAPSPTNENYGFQIWRASPYLPSRGYGSGASPSINSAEPFLAADMLIFDGAVGQRIYISRAKKLVIVRIGDAIFDWDDSWLPNRIVSGLD